MQVGRDIRTVVRGDGYHYAAWQNAYVLTWTKPASKESLDAAVSGKRDVLARFPKGVAVINLVRPDVDVPSAEVREYAKAKQVEDSVGVLCHSTVIDGSGFWASGMRAILAGLYMVQREAFPRKVFSTSSEAIDWMAQTTRQDVEWVAGVSAAVEWLRRYA
ncbi:MAG: hypothetical protein U0230_10940 [Polyangiales bacterium]